MSEVIIPHNHNLDAMTSVVEADTDFIGFTFNGKHSSELGIVRTSDGSRFNESLLPVISDKTVQVPGADETYYFGSYYTHQVFDIPFAFDNLTEQKFAELKRWLGDKKIHDLVFDERPYKIYSAKITGSATIKHIPFSEGETNRVYKGEGSIQFTAFKPFARSAFKYLDQYNTVIKTLQPTVNIKLDEDMCLGILDWNENNLPIPGKTYRITYNNLEIIDIATESMEDGIHRIFFGNEKISIEYHFNFKDVEFWGLEEDAGKVVSIKIEQIEQYKNIPEWKDAANLLDSQGDFDKLNGNEVPLYNPGVKEADFVLALKFLTDTIPAGYISIDGSDLILKMNFKQIVKQGANDVEIRFNSKLNLIEGYDENGLKTGTVYNRFITSGDFFKIPISTKVEEPLVLVLDGVYSNFSFIDYDYLYF